MVAYPPYDGGRIGEELTGLSHTVNCKVEPSSPANGNPSFRKRTAINSHTIFRFPSNWRPSHKNLAIAALARPALPPPALPIPALPIPAAPHLQSYAGETTATAQNILQFEGSFSRSTDRGPSSAAAVESAPFPPKQFNARFAMARGLIASAVTGRVAIGGSRC
jgi:hypothetical protein